MTGEIQIDQAALDEAVEKAMAQHRGSNDQEAVIGSVDNLRRQLAAGAYGTPVTSPQHFDVGLTLSQGGQWNVNFAWHF